MTEGVCEAKVEKDFLDELKQKIYGSPKPDIPVRETCISRIPYEFINKLVDKKYQVPQIVSIGPYHNKDDNLKVMDEHKWLYVRSFVTENMSKTFHQAMNNASYIPRSIRDEYCTRPFQFKSNTFSAAAEDKSPDLDVYFKVITEIKDEARNCYCGGVDVDTDEFVKMMIRDGCFILELFLRSDSWREFEPEDPISKMLRVSSTLYNDLLLFENQIPFLVLTKLFRASLSENLKKYNEDILINLALRFFNNVMRRTQGAIKWYSYANYGNELPLHLLDLVRSSFITPLQKLPKDNKPCFVRLLCAGNGTVNLNHPCNSIPCVSKLLRAGIEVKPSNAESFLAVKFKSGVIHMPSIFIDDSMSSFLVNCVAFEQSKRNISKYFMRYVAFLDCLSNTKEDVDLLYERKVIEHGFHKDDQLANFINRLGKSLPFGFGNVYQDDFDNLYKLFQEVDAYYRSGIRWKWADFKREYCNKPWLLISAFVALLYLLLTFGQTFIASYAYVHPKTKQ